MFPERATWRFFFQSRIGLALLILVSCAAAQAGEECRRIVQCSEYAQAYRIAAETCRAELRSFNCEAYRKDKELGRFLRSCSPEDICEERRLTNQASQSIPGCTGITKSAASKALSDIATCAKSLTCWKLVPAETVRNLGRMVVGAGQYVWKLATTTYQLITNTRETLSVASAGAAEYTRRYQCFNTEYHARVACEIAGGSFNAMTLGSVSSLVKGPGALRAATRVERLSTRASVIAEREAAGRGVRSSAMRAVRETAKAGVVVNAAANASAASREKPKKPGQEAAPKPAAKPTSTAAADAARESYIQRLLGRQNTTIEQRRAFAELAAKTTSDGKTLFVNLQNSKMKYLNDHLGNKNVVTALTNRRLELTFERFNDLKARYPNLKLPSYDDFKSGQFAFTFTDGKVPAGFKKEIDSILDRTQDEYIAELGRVGIIPEGSEILPPEGWFASGSGRTGDESNAASRYAARTGQNIVDFWDPVVRKNLEGRLTQTDTYRAGIMKAYKGTPLSTRLPNGELIPSDDVFEAYRKSKDASSFATLVEERTGVKMAAQAAQSMRQYLSMLDEWSPSLLIVEARQDVTFAGSKFNGVTIDVSGMGALNMRELATALVGTRDIDKALVRARESEKAATEVFARNKAAIVEAAESSLREQGITANVRVSGDDIIVLPTNKALTPEALEQMHIAIARSASTSNVRISAVASKTAHADQMALTGETLEKKVRVSTQTAIRNQGDYTLMVVTDQSGRPSLRVAGRRGDVPADVEQAYQAAFTQALAK
jgi:hypothetical protein